MALRALLHCGSGGRRDPLPEDDEFLAADLEPLDSESGRRESASMLRQLSVMATPYVVSNSDDAFVNLAALKNGQAAAPALATPGTGFARLKSVAPSSGLEWTESRKLLEAAIVFEQVDPKVDPAGQHAWRADLAAAEWRLAARLHTLGLDMAVQAGDGNCQFRSLSFGLYGTPAHHSRVRAAAVDCLRRRRPQFEAFLGEEFGAYAREMARQGVWGDELTLRAAAEAFGVCINVVTSDAANWFMRYVPEHAIVRREVFISYIAPVHYNAIVRRPRGAAPFLRSMSSLGRRNSRIVEALDEYERTRAVPAAPTEVLT